LHHQGLKDVIVTSLLMVREMSERYLPAEWLQSLDVFHQNAKSLQFAGSHPHVFNDQ
jgi:hypothetical protein